MARFINEINQNYNYQFSNTFNGIKQMLQKCEGMFASKC